MPIDPAGLAALPPPRPSPLHGHNPPLTSNTAQPLFDKAISKDPGETGERLRQAAWDSLDSARVTRGGIKYDLYPGEVQSPEGAAELLLASVAGLDPTDMHARKTPDRFVRMLRELTTSDPFEFTTFPSEHDEMIVIRGIPFASLCSHHVIPFIGKADIAYVPGSVIAGLSKFARVVNHFARALQVQERLTGQIADFLDERLQPLGVAVVLEAEHLCMTIRGIQAQGTTTCTSAMRGVFSDHTKTAKAEFLDRINRK